MRRAISTLMFYLMVISSLAAYGSDNYVNRHIKSVTAITEIFADGQKLTTVAIEYDKNIENSKLSKSAFSVEGRTITNVYANTAAAKTAQGINGRYVIIELSPSDNGAAIFVQRGRTSTRSEAKVSVIQTGDIMTADGEKYSSGPDAMTNSSVVNLIVDDFKQFEYKDPKTELILRYNLFVPKNYNKNKSYPLVLFMHDAGATNTDPKTTLIQGIGAVIWATPSEQTKHECFVLAPQYSTQIVNDNSEASEFLDITVDLVNSIVSQYSIDKNRLYTTGQSGGCMMSIAIDIKYPDLFAASFLVAGQWDAAKVTPMANDKLWIIVSEKDMKAFPGMNAITATLEKEGAKVSRATWNGQSSTEEFASEVSKMISEGNNIKYSVLKKGTVVPAGMKDDGGSNHVFTWRIAYNIEGVRDWLFMQKKTPEWETVAGQSKDPLLFPRDNFTVETKTVKTSAGEKKVTYRSYMHIPYVANPVDKDYQSMNVSVPVKVDDEAVDATNAPILFTIGVGGYMSVNNMRGGFSGPRAGGNADLALAAGYVVVSPGCRGRENKAADGTYYGKAPAAIVDLKAAIRYIRHNKGVLPGNTVKIVSVGCSAGGALSALLGTSGNSPLYDKYLKEIGAADGNDNIFASACFSPITDLEHADMDYEWNYGTISTRSGLVNQELSKQLKASFAEYQASLKLKGKSDFGTLIADNYDKYLLQYYLIPSANKYLKNLTEDKRKEYLTNNKWITWTDAVATFTFAEYAAHVGRMKGLPAFDDFDMKQPEPNLFGNKTTDSRHFTSFSLQYSTGNKSADIDNDLKTLVNMMNAMYFLGQNRSSCAGYWWLRNGTSDNHTSQTVMVNLATSLENRDKEVDAWVFWDGGHCSDDEPEEFIRWIGKVTGFSKQ